MIDAKEMKKLMTHSKKHAGGMKSKHMQYEKVYDGRRQFYRSPQQG